MRSNQDLAGSSNGRLAGKLGVSGMPLDWVDAGSWRLPSGKALAEFALQAGFLAPLLFRPGHVGHDEDGTGSEGRPARMAAVRSKHCGKGESR